MHVAGFFWWERALYTGDSNKTRGVEGMTAMKIRLLYAVTAVCTACAGALAQTQTAQSAMVQINLDSGAYQIEGEIEWSYDWSSQTAAVAAFDTYFTIEAVGSPSTSQLNPAKHKAMQDNKCNFFCGTPLETVTHPGGTNHWKCVPKAPGQYDPYTGWTSEITGGGPVEVGFDGFVSSESFQLQKNGRYKYSFTLLNSDLTSRAQNVAAWLEKWDAITSTWTIEGMVPYGTLPVSASSDYEYNGNGGAFGNAAVFGALHTDTGLGSALVSSILASDNFAGNDGDLSAGEVHHADYAGSFSIADEGSYRIVITGVIKGNNAKTTQSFEVTSELIVIGGCGCGG